jgi:phosphoribosylanthranilate isomerase
MMIPTVRLVQVIHVRGPESFDEAQAIAPLVDEILLDSGNPGAPVKELGGTGRVHDWAVSRRIVRESGVPVWLAGGLRPENVASAVREVSPHGVDVCSGLREEGILDPQRLTRFVAALTPAS